MSDSTNDLRSDPVIENLYDIATTWANQHEVTVASVFTFTTHLMGCVQSMVGDKKGAYKKRVVLTVLRRVVPELSQLSDTDKASILGAVDNIVPSLIDGAVAIAHNPATIKTLKTLAQKFGCCSLYSR